MNDAAMLMISVPPYLCMVYDKHTRMFMQMTRTMLAGSENINGIVPTTTSEQTGALDFLGHR